MNIVIFLIGLIVGIVIGIFLIMSLAFQWRLKKERQEEEFYGETNEGKVRSGRNEGSD